MDWQTEETVPHVPVEGVGENILFGSKGDDEEKAI
jgi:hypothetical protein